MRLLVLGDCEWLRTAGVDRRAREGARYDLAAILPDAGEPRARITCHTLLLWETEAARWLEWAEAAQAVSCGFSPQNTLTPASLRRGGGILTVQRELRRPDGRYVWPQDVPVPTRWAALPLPQQLMLTGLHLLGAEL